MPDDPRRHGGNAALAFGLACLVAATAGLLNGTDETPYVAGIGVCLIALGYWLRAAR